MEGKKRYIVTITEESFEKVLKGKEWAKGAGKTPEDYGYTPEIEKTVIVERKVFEQNTDNLDLVSVIRAVNGI